MIYRLRVNTIMSIMIIRYESYLLSELLECSQKYRLIQTDIRNYYKSLLSVFEISLYFGNVDD